MDLLAKLNYEHIGARISSYDLAGRKACTSCTRFNGAFASGGKLNRDGHVGILTSAALLRDLKQRCKLDKTLFV